MRPNQIFVPSLIVAAVGAAFFLPAREVAAPERPPVPEPDVHARDFEAWSPELERGGSVRLVRSLCDTQKAEYLQRTGEVAPEFVDAGSITTYGPLPDDKANAFYRVLMDIADGTMTTAEGMEVETLEDARAQMAEVLDAMKARDAAASMLLGHYWTMDRTSHPRLPAGYTYWRARIDHALPDGRGVDVLVPIDLRSAELRATHDALLALENDLRTDHCETFNRMAREDRKSLCEDAWRAADGEHVDRDIPKWFWTLEIDKGSWLGTPRLAKQ